jgi:hypothetical protein
VSISAGLLQLAASIAGSDLDPNPTEVEARRGHPAGLRTAAVAAQSLDILGLTPIDSPVSSLEQQPYTAGRLPTGLDPRVDVDQISDAVARLARPPITETVQHASGTLQTSRAPQAAMSSPVDARAKRPYADTAVDTYARVALTAPRVDRGIIRFDAEGLSAHLPTIRVQAPASAFVSREDLGSEPFAAESLAGAAPGVAPTSRELRLKSRTLLASLDQRSASTRHQPSPFASHASLRRVEPSQTRIQAQLENERVMQRQLADKLRRSANEQPKETIREFATWSQADESKYLALLAIICVGCVGLSSPFSLRRPVNES